jgi:PhnB protein
MADPLDALHRASAPIAPRREFAAGLRRRLEAAVADLVPIEPEPDPTRSTVDLGRRKETTMDQSTVTAPTPATAEPLVAATSVRVDLVVSGAADAIDFYVAAFGAVETMRLMQPDGRVGHAELRIGGDVTFSIADEFPEYDIVGPATLGGSPVSFTLFVPDCDASFARAVAAGAIVDREPSDEFYGARAARLRDRWGHRWSLHTPTEEVSVDEMQRRLDVMDEG